jgi:hypothetical protein
VVKSVGVWGRGLIVVATGIVAGLWAWGDLDSVHFWGHGALSEVGYDTAFQIAMVALLFVAGFVVRRWCVALATVGPLLALGLAQAANERGMDGWAPLTSPPGVSRLIWTALILLLGFWIGAQVDRRSTGDSNGSR